MTQGRCSRVLCLHEFRIALDLLRPSPPPQNCCFQEETQKTVFLIVSLPLGEFWGWRRLSCFPSLMESPGI